MSALVEDAESVFDLGVSSAPLLDVSQPPAESSQPSSDQPTEQPAEGEQKPGDQSQEIKPEGEQQPPESQKRTDWRAETFKTRGELQARESRIAELEAQIAERDGEFVGIRLEGPVEGWNVKEQYLALPEPVFDKLTEAVITTPGILDTFVKTTLSDPGSNPDAEQLLLAATGAICEQRLGMPFERIARILTVTQHLRDDQLNQLAQGVIPEGVEPVRGSNELYQMFEQAGVDTADPTVRAVISRVDHGFMSQASRLAEAFKRIDQLEGRTSERWQQETARFADEVHGLVDQQVEQAIQAEIESELKDRLPPGEARDELMPFLIQGVKDALSKNPQAASRPAEMKQMATDLANGKRELHPKVTGQLRAYSVHVKSAAKTAVGRLLKHTVVAQSNQQRAADAAKPNGQLVGAASGAVGNEQNPDLATLQNVRPRSIAEAQEYAVRLNQARRAQQ